MRVDSELPSPQGENMYQFAGVTFVRPGDLVEIAFASPASVRLRDWRDSLRDDFRPSQNPAVPLTADIRPRATESRPRCFAG